MVGSRGVGDFDLAGRFLVPRRHYPSQAIERKDAARNVTRFVAQLWQCFGRASLQVRVG
jgi:hypothetical protein